ncbi:MAG TPA: endonuclease/exonuclease/phosphatase family protein [Pirellulales bacterium]|nr:endonuclease/exonuclease/phosphatase family protein [Pirellulales bacterium]
MSTMLWGTRPDGSKVGFNLKVLTYNTHLLPRISEPFASRRGRGDYRARTIGARVAAFDLVGLCEVFDDRRRQALVEAAEATGGRYHVVWTKKPPLKGLTNSGLLLLSRFPVEAHHAITYDHASRFITHGFRADAFAAKGAIHARLRVRDAPPLGIDCFLTHLDSRSAAARAGQLRQLSGFIRTHAGGDRMVLLMGDLNVPADSSPFATDSSYTQLVASLAASGLDWVDAWATAGTGAGGTSDPLADDGGQRIDYIWLACGPSLDPNRVLQHIQVLRYLDGGVPEGSLSDHSGLACKLSDP